MSSVWTVNVADMSKLGGGGSVFRVKIFAVIVPSKTPFLAFLTLKKMLAKV